MALGWKESQVVTIDNDRGQSGISSHRGGFRRLLSEVALGRAGIVMALEVSRLTRSPAEWWRFLESCALAQTLLLDKEALYDPSRRDDRILLGTSRIFSGPEIKWPERELLLAEASRAIVDVTDLGVHGSRDGAEVLSAE